jgi:hypothetical protein
MLLEMNSRVKVGDIQAHNLVNSSLPLDLKVLRQVGEKSFKSSRGVADNQAVVNMHPDVDGDVVALVDIDRRLHLRGGEIKTREDLLEMKPPAPAGLLGAIESFVQSEDLSFEGWTKFGRRLHIHLFLDGAIKIGRANVKRVGGKPFFN